MILYVVYVPISIYVHTYKHNNIAININDTSLMNIYIVVLEFLLERVHRFCYHFRYTFISLKVFLLMFNNISLGKFNFRRTHAQFRVY